MAVATCGCGCVSEPDGVWVVATPDSTCPLGHRGGERGHAEGKPTRVVGIGECVTVVFERQSRTALLTTLADVSRS